MGVVAAGVPLVVGCRRLRRPRRAPAARRCASGDTLETPVAARKMTVFRPSVFRQEVEALSMGNYAVDEVEGVSTGWPSVDEYYRPVKGEFSMVTGSPGAGKSEFLLAMVTNLAEKHGWKIGLALLETRDTDLLMQLLEKRNRMHWDDIKKEGEEDPLWRGNQTEGIKDQFDVLAANFVQPSIDEVLERAQESADRRGMDGLIIDPYNYIAQYEGRWVETEFVNLMLTKIRAFASRNKCHVWLVAHPAKKAFEKPDRQHNAKPSEPDGLSLYDISGSAHFFNKCDMGLVVERHPGDTMVLRVKKVRNREAGQPGSATLHFDKHTRCYFEDTERNALEKTLLR